MRKYLLPFVFCGVLAARLSAQPIYTHTADFFSGTWTPGVGYSLQSSGPGFSYPFISGGGGGFGNPSIFHVGDGIALDFGFAASLGSPVGMVDFGGIVLPSHAIAGVVDQTSNASFVIPPNPNGTYTFPAMAVGQYTVVAECIINPQMPTCPPLGTEANLLVNLPGELTVEVHNFGPGAYTIREVFVSTAVPEPSTIALLTLAMGATGVCFGLSKRHKRDRLHRRLFFY